MDELAKSKLEAPDFLEGEYQITSVLRENMKMDVSGGAKTNQAKIQLYESNGTAATQIQQYSWNGSRAQKWLPIKEDDGTYTMYSALGRGMVLDVEAACISNGARLQTYAVNGTKTQIFCFFSTSSRVESQEKTIEDGYYYIGLSTNNQMVLDLRNGNNSNGNQIQVYSSNNTLAQCFKIEYCKDGFYRIRIA